MPARPRWDLAAHFTIALGAAATWLVLAVHLLGVGPPIALAARRWAVRGDA